MKNIFYKIVIFAFLLIMLCGCAKNSPVENIVEQHSNHIEEILDFSYNNIEQTLDIVFLEKELDSCKLALIDVKQAYYGELGACKADIRYWRLATFGLFILLCGAIFVLIKRWF